ncbi:hypothetical protein VTJ04DRAFT_9249 [Mycothermus thermophilus]|uniref:uncharacterized protein n=1 Tax=Humicola insolens TaxID=85995 RepID=UPI00374281F1
MDTVRHGTVTAQGIIERNGHGIHGQSRHRNCRTGAEVCQQQTTAAPEWTDEWKGEEGRGDLQSILLFLLLSPGPVDMWPSRQVDEQEDHGAAAADDLEAPANTKAWIGRVRRPEPWRRQVEIQSRAEMLGGWDPAFDDLRQPETTDARLSAAASALLKQVRNSGARTT